MYGGSAGIDASQLRWFRPKHSRSLWKQPFQLENLPIQLKDQNLQSVFVKNAKNNRKEMTGNIFFNIEHKVGTRHKVNKYISILSNS